MNNSNITTQMKLQEKLNPVIIKDIMCILNGLVIEDALFHLKEVENEINSHSVVSADNFQLQPLLYNNQ
jgi:hypothetical protein